MPLTSDQEEQKLRKEVLRNDQLVRQQAAGHGTLFSHAIAASEEIGGRFAAVGRASVTGSAPIPHAQLPAPSWAGQDTMVEPPLGYAIDDQPVIGEPFELERAAEILREREVAAAALPSAADVDRVVEAPTAVRHHAGETATRSTQSQSLAITGAAVVGGAGNSSAAKAVPRTFPRRL